LPRLRRSGVATDLLLAGKLTTLFLDQFKAKSPTVEGLAHTTRRHVTSFHCLSQQQRGVSIVRLNSIDEEPVASELLIFYNSKLDSRLHLSFRLNRKSAILQNLINPVYLIR
jgi:hypothetical protein